MLIKSLICAIEKKTRLGHMMKDKSKADQICELIFKECAQLKALGRSNFFRISESQKC